MSIDANQEFQSFHNFIGQQLGSGMAALSPEEALEAWRLQNRSQDEMEEDVQAVREALADMAGGDLGMPVDEYLAAFRKRHRIDETT